MNNDGMHNTCISRAKTFSMGTLLLVFAGEDLRCRIADPSSYVCHAGYSNDSSRTQQPQSIETRLASG